MSAASPASVPPPDRPSLELVPGRPKPSTPSAPSKTRKPVDDRWPILVIVLVPVLLTLWGWSYYAAPAGVRLRSPLHALLKPSGPVGLGLGVLAFAGFLFLWLYPLRKKVKALAWTGAVGSWLRIHIFAGIAIPLLAAVHAGWRFDGLIGLGYLSMLLVALSGIIGRYLYVRIPRSRSGLELTMDEVQGRRRSLITEIAARTGEDPLTVERELALRNERELALTAGIARARATASGPLAILFALFADDWARRRAVARLKRRWSGPMPNGTRHDNGAVRTLANLAKQELGLAQQLRMLDATRSVFGLWHVVHRPFALLALLAVAIHVVVAIVVGGVSFALPH